MRAFKSRGFVKWASDEGLTDGRLWAVVEEMERGLMKAELGGHVYKKRIALRGHGKRGGARVVLVYRKGSRAFFMEGFAKKDRDNIPRDELRVLKAQAKELLNYSARDLMDAIETGRFVEVRGDERHTDGTSL